MLRMTFLSAGNERVTFNDSNLNVKPGKCVLSNVSLLVRGRGRRGGAKPALQSGRSSPQPGSQKQHQSSARGETACTVHHRNHSNNKHKVGMRLQCNLLFVSPRRTRSASTPLEEGVTGQKTTQRGDPRPSAGG